MGVAVGITGSLKGALSNTLKNEVPFRSHRHCLVLPVLGFCAYLSSPRFSPNRTNVESHLLSCLARGTPPGALHRVRMIHLRINKWPNNLRIHPHIASGGHLTG